MNMMLITCSTRLSFRVLTCPIWCWQVTCAMTKNSQWVTTMASRTPGSTVSLVGQGSFLAKPSLHVVGYLGKNSLNINSPHDEWCPVCKTTGQTQALRTYRINLTQSILLCPNPQCIYPLGYTPLDNLIANTADLKKNNSPRKPKKRNSSNSFPTPLVGEKRPKIDLPISVDSLAVQDDICNAALESPPLEWEIHSPTRLHHGQKDGTDPPMQNGSGTAIPLSSSALWDKSGFPVLPTGSFSRNALDQPDVLPAVQNGHREVLQNGELEVVNTLNNTSPLYLPLETNLRANKVANTEEKVMTETLNREHKLSVRAFSPDSMSSGVTPLTEQNRAQECQLIEISSKETPVPPCSNIMFDLESELPPGCNEQPTEHFEKMDDLIDKGDVKDVVPPLPRDAPVDVSGNAVFSELLLEESEQPMNLSSLLDISPSACPEHGVQDCSFGIANLSESLELVQESGEKTEDRSDWLQECPEESQHFGKPLSSPLSVNGEKSQPTITLYELEKQLTEILSKDKSDTASLEAIGSMVTTEDPSVPIPNLSLLQEMVQKCQTTYSEENGPSNFLQDVLPESKVEDNALKNTCDNHTTCSVQDQVSAEAAVISSPGNQLPKILDTTDPCPDSDLASPIVSLPDHEHVCHPDNGSVERVCEVLGPSESIKDDYDKHTDGNSQNKMTLLKPQILLKDCMKCHCEKSVPSPSLHEDSCDSPPSSPPSVEGDHSYAKHPMTEVKVLLQDYLKCHCGNTLTLNKISASEVCTAMCGVKPFTDHETVSAQSYCPEDCTAVVTIENTAAAPSPDCESLTSKKQKFSENAVLPDLLLDIPSKHRIEESMTKAPSLEYDATKSGTWQDGKVSEHDNAMEILQNIIEDGSKASDTLETSVNSDEATAEDGDDDMEAESEGTAQGDKVLTAKKLKPEQRMLQWKNKHNLCWLDCILSTLVHSETLNNFVAEDYDTSKESLIPDLFMRYNQATGMFLEGLALKKKRKADHRRPKYEKCLHEVRISIFEKLQPLLKCKLGKKESPVFAFPLLLKLDPLTENLFMHSFIWHFQCEVCEYSYQQRCQKSLTTFTKVVPEWHPLNAVHLGPCNRCRHSKQKRTMVLEKLNSFFMVHFVDGSPTNDLDKYSFQFQGHLYEVKAIIKYKNNHFASWVLNTDGSWLESDGLRGSFCRRYRKINVRADAIHIVIWERSGGKSFEENVQFGAAEQASELNSANISTTSEDPSFSSVETSERSRQVAPTVPSVDLNTSDPLAGMESYADDDVITLTLVAIPSDVNGSPVDTADNRQATDTCRSNKDPSQGEGTSTALLEMSTNVQPEVKEDTTLTSPVSSDSNAETASLKNCSVEGSPMIKSPLNPEDEAIATSTPSRQPYNREKSIAGNWMSQLMRKNNSALNSDLLAANGKMQSLKAHPPLKTTDSSDAPKKAQNFNGFLGRSTSKTNFLASNIFPSQIANKPTLNVLNEKGAVVANPLTMSTASDFKTPGSNGSDYSKMIKEGSSSSEDKIRRLRLKLLKKLKAKKNELATLEKLAKKQESGPTGAQANGAPHGSFNRKDHLRGFVQELQEHIDNADNESVCTMSSCTSLCSSPGDAEFFNELFSPSPADGQPNDSRYLEMLADGCGISADGHLHEGSGGVQHSASGSNSCPTVSKLNSSAVDGSLNLMSGSAVAVLGEDNDYFDFDDYF
ncbi:SUMO-specific isopeptidase USPL1 isoform X1 [Ranitomeya imitator]|uniref:SUMO-specific isopeptidase USPL1 isoform X1 n=2 Tax=Ranitomeya imitator TaxID=111125 RepID=UPI0037E7E343